jgi:hypothetical protein
MPWTAWYTTARAARGGAVRLGHDPRVDNPTLQFGGGNSNNLCEMPLSTPVRIQLALSADEADTLLQVLLEAPVPSDADESHVNAILLRLAQTLTSATNDPAPQRLRRPAATCA